MDCSRPSAGWLYTEGGRHLVSGPALLLAVWLRRESALDSLIAVRSLRCASTAASRGKPTRVLRQSRATAPPECDLVSARSPPTSLLPFAPRNQHRASPDVRRHRGMRAFQ